MYSYFLESTNVCFYLKKSVGKIYNTYYESKSSVSRIGIPAQTRWTSTMHKTASFLQKRRRQSSRVVYERQFPQNVHINIHARTWLILEGVHDAHIRTFPKKKSNLHAGARLLWRKARLRPWRTRRLATLRKWRESRRACMHQSEKVTFTGADTQTRK